MVEICQKCLAEDKLEPARVTIHHGGTRPNEHLCLVHFHLQNAQEGEG